MKAGTDFPYVLPNEYQSLFALAALFEKDLSIDWVVSLCRKRVSWVLSAFEEGVKQGFLVNKGKGIYSFSDAKGRRTFEGHLTPQEKSAFHNSIASLLIQELPQDDNTLQLIAKHLICTSNDIKGCHLLSKAADLHLKNLRINEAIQYYEKVIDDLNHLHGKEADSLFSQVTINYCKISFSRRDINLRKKELIIRDALERAKALGIKKDEALLQMYLSKNYWFSYQYPAARRHFERALAIAKELGDSEFLCSITTFSVYYFFLQGKFREAVKSYENIISDRDMFPQIDPPFLLSVAACTCYAHTGQITLSLSILDNLRSIAIEKHDYDMLSYVTNAIGHIMLLVRQTDNAIHHLETSLKVADQGKNRWIKVLAMLMLSVAYSLNGDFKQSERFFHRFVKEKDNITFKPDVFAIFLIDVCWLIKQKKIHNFSDLSLSKEISRMLKSDNAFERGVALRHESQLWRNEKNPCHRRIIQNLELSIDLLNKSGSLIELIKAQFDLVREYYLYGDEESARKCMSDASKNLLPFGEFGKRLVPDDLRSLLPEFSRRKKIHEEMLELAKKITTVRNNRDLLQNILSELNKIIGAERSAIFLIDEDSGSLRLFPEGSKKITQEEITTPDFSSSMEMIQRVAYTAKGFISAASPQNNNSFVLKKTIQSRICVPIVLKNKVVGSLYQDNRLLKNAFNTSDLAVSSYFAALAAIIFDNYIINNKINQLYQELDHEKGYHGAQFLQNFHNDDIVGVSPAIREVVSKVNQVASYDNNVLILGESGVGKELVARAIHQQSRRSNNRFIRVNCGALPKNLIESELFGYEKGAFTGADRRNIGRIELANKGTLFLDEIGELRLDLQVRLLHVLQDGKFERIGGSESIYSDFRLLTATNRDLEKEIKKNRFRLDLYYRLNVFPIYIPPLRERKEDIPLLAHHFLQLSSAKAEKNFSGISKAEMEKLLQYDWPGNVRELQNIIERGVILSSKSRFQVPKMDNNQSRFNLNRPGMSLKEAERHHILSTLKKTRWKVRGPGGAAELLEINPSTLKSRMKKLGIHRPSGIRRIRTSANTGSL